MITVSRAAANHRAHDAHKDHEELVVFGFS
jgi:hypothetical protein